MDDAAKRRPGPEPRRGVGIVSVRCAADLRGMLGVIAKHRNMTTSELLDKKLLAWAAKEVEAIEGPKE